MILFKSVCVMPGSPTDLVCLVELCGGGTRVIARCNELTYDNIFSKPMLVSSWEIEPGECRKKEDELLLKTHIVSVFNSLDSLALLHSRLRGPENTLTANAARAAALVKPTERGDHDHVQRAT